MPSHTSSIDFFSPGKLSILTSFGSPNSSKNRDLKFLGYIFLVGYLHILLINHGVLHGGIYLRMPQQPLHLFNGHALINGSGSQGSSEFMGMDLGNSQFPPQAPQPDFHAADLQAVIGFQQGYEKGRIIIGPGIQVVL